MLCFWLGSFRTRVTEACVVLMQRNVKAALGQSETAPLLLPDSAAKLAALPANVVQALHVSCCTAALRLNAGCEKCVTSKLLAKLCPPTEFRNTGCRPLSLLWCLRR